MKENIKTSNKKSKILIMCLVICVIAVGFLLFHNEMQKIVELNETIDTLYWFAPEVTEKKSFSEKIDIAQKLSANDCEEYNTIYQQWVKNSTTPVADNYVGKYRTNMQGYIVQNSKNVYVSVIPEVQINVQNNMAQGILSITYSFEESDHNNHEMNNVELQYPFYREVKDGKVITYVQDQQGKWWHGPARDNYSTNAGYDLIKMLNTISLETDYPPTFIKSEIDKKDYVAATVELSEPIATTKYTETFNYNENQMATGVVFANLDGTLKNYSILAYDNGDTDQQNLFWQEYGDHTCEILSEFHVCPTADFTISVDSYGDAQIDMTKFAQIEATYTDSFDFVCADMYNHLLQLSNI